MLVPASAAAGAQSLGGPPPPSPAVAIIVSTDPSDGATGVALDASIVVTFSEPVDPPNITFTISPPIVMRVFWSANYTVLTLSHATPFTECTQYTVGIVGIPPGPVSNPWTFVTLCDNPEVLSTNPAQGDTDVPLTAPIVVTFSEPMNTASVTWTITPTIALDPPVWSAGDTVFTLSHVSDFTQCTVYQVQVAGDDLAGLALIPGPVPNPWTFSTTTCVVNLLAPAGGEDWTGGSVHPTQWEQYSPTGSAMNWTLEWTGGGTTESWPKIPVISGPYPGGPYDQYLYDSGFAPNGSRQRTDVPPGPVWAIWTAQFFNGSDVDYGIFQDLDCDAVYAVGDLFSGFAMATGANPERFIASFPPAGCYWVHVAGFDAVPGVTTTTITFTTESWALIASGSAGNGTFSYDWTVPLVNTTTARVRACVSPYAPPPTCDTGDPLTIDSTAPALISHIPADGALDVPLVAYLTVVFSEGMDTTSVERAFWSSPPAFVISTVWPDPTTIVITIESLRSATTYSWGFDCSATDRSDPGNALANCQERHSFTTEGGTGGPPSVTITAPLGGESWSGGSPHPVTFSADNPGTVTRLFNVTASYRYAGGAFGGIIGWANLTIPAGGTMSSQIPWTVALVDATDAVVNITAQVVGGGGWTLSSVSGPFEIDSTLPTIIRADPAVIFPWDPIVVTFSEAMARGSTEGAISITPGVGGVTFTWTAPTVVEVAHSDFLCGVVYVFTVGGGARDDSDPGNSMAPAPFTLAFLPACPPTVDILSPGGGEDWTGGTDHAIRWDSSDTDDVTLSVTLSYSIDGGADGFPHAIVNDLVVDIGGGSYLWTLPRIDSASVLVRIRVTDATGNAASDTSAAVFTIDSTPPSLLASFPSHGSSGHKTTRDVWFVWTEPVDRTSFRSAFGLAPDPGGLGYEWTVSNLGGDVLLVSHDPLKSRTDYAATFAVSAKDDSDPGNPLASVVTVRFTTQPPPPVDPPVALAVGQHQVPAGEPTTFDGSGSTGDIVSYAWRIVDNQDRFVAVLVGERATYALPREGRYSVTLIVTDARGATDEDSLEIVATSSPNGGDIALAAAAGGALLAAALIGATEVGKLLAFQLLLIPLYARLKRDELLEQEKRGMIRGYILVHPGDSYSDIKRNLNLPNGTLSYHLGILEREGIVRSQARGTRRLYFPVEARFPEDGGGMHEVQIRMLRAVQAIPGLAVTDLAAALGISSQLALYHLRDLAAAGAIRFERRGLRLRCFPVDSTDAPKI